MLISVACQFTALIAMMEPETHGFRGIFLPKSDSIVWHGFNMSCQTISNRDSSKMVFKTLVETAIIGGVFRLSFNIMYYCEEYDL